MTAGSRGLTAALALAGAGLLPGLAACSREGRHDAALAVEARALEAIRAGRLDDAEALVREMARAGDEAFEPRVAFARGRLAWARSEAAEAAAAGPGADPTMLEFAIVRAEDAVAAWRRAAASREDWPAARRNVERALLRVERLRKAKGERDKKPDAKPPPDPKPPPRPDLWPPPPPPPPPLPPKPPDARQPTPSPDDALPDLTPEALARLLERIAAQEQAKRAKRAAVRVERSAGVEKDW